MEEGEGSRLLFSADLCRWSRVFAHFTDFFVESEKNEVNL